MDKYNIGFPRQVIDQNTQRLINQIWKLVPMREHEEDWITQLKTVTEEISGLVEIYKYKPDGLTLLSKLEGLTSETCNDFMIYRKTVFRCMDLLVRVLEDE